MRIDVTMLGISGNSLRWLRRLAPWSIVPLILGALVLATVALGSMQYHGSMGQSGYGHHHEWAQPGYSEPYQAVEGPYTTGSVQLPVGKSINILQPPGWPLPKLNGSSLEPSGFLYQAVKPGRSVLTASNGAEQWKYTVVVVPAGH